MAESLPQKSESRQTDKEQFRLFLLDSLFQEDRYYTKDELCTKLHISAPTLYRDFERLRSKYNAPIAYDSVHQGYHYTSHLFKLPALFVSENEMPAYSLVLKLFEMFQDTPLYRPLINLCETFESPVKIEMVSTEQMNVKNSELPEKQWFETRIVMASRPVDSVPEDVWDIILLALKENRILEFDYETVNENRKSLNRTIEPWQLIYDREQWYITGMSQNGLNRSEKAVRTFAVPRMENIHLLTGHFNLPDEKIWKLDKAGVGRFGVQIVGKPEPYKFIFQGSALYFSTADFAKGKKVEPYTGPLPHKDGAVLVSFMSNQWPAILKEFFPYGEDIVPLEPEILVKEWKKKIRGLMKYL